jgi:hypothetical protein
MSPLETIALRDCKVYRRWIDAPDGTFLQVRPRPEEQSTVIFKCQAQIAGKIYKPCIVALNSDNFGRMGNLREQAWALDVSSDFEFCLKDQIPSSRSEMDMVGSMFAHDDGAFFMLVGAERQTGYACIRTSETFALGRIYYTVSNADVYEVGKLTLNPVNRIERAIAGMWSRQVSQGVPDVRRTRVP